MGKNVARSGVMKKWSIGVSAFFLLMLISIIPPFIKAKDSVEKTSVYELELKRWGVHNDGTHAVETTNGINVALQWAKENDYNTLKIPDGSYLIAKGLKIADPEA